MTGPPPAMDAERRALRDALLALGGTGSADHHGRSAYMGSPHGLLGVAVPDLRRLAKSWLAANTSLPPDAILAVADSLFAGPLHEEKTLAALILGYSKPARRAATLDRVDGWLDRLVGWAEIDALCSIFAAEEMLGDWADWAPWLRDLAASENINKRRASLVLLTGPVRSHDDPRLLEVALDNLGRLQAERAILITKAVSWLLRSLVPRHREVVAGYLDAHRSALPAIAVRETSAKLETGRKSRTQRD